MVVGRVEDNDSGRLNDRARVVVVAVVVDEAILVEHANAWCVHLIQRNPSMYRGCIVM